VPDVRQARWDRGAAGVSSPSWGASPERRPRARHTRDDRGRPKQGKTTVTYPKASTHTGTSGVARARASPRSRKASWPIGNMTAHSRPPSSSVTPGRTAPTSSSSTMGRPLPTGLPHYGHLFTGYVKDIVPRYQTMRGRRVERRFGWDTHGLPAELEAHDASSASRRPRTSSTSGIAEFNDKPAAPRSSNTPTSGETYVTRQARWVDFDNDYKTLDPTYMESVIWAFKQLARQGPGLRGLPDPALLLERPDAAVQPRAADGRGRLPDASGPGDHRRLPPGDRRAGPHLDDDPVDAAVEHGRRRAPGRRLCRRRG
jgi:hypothetical protein